VSDELRARVAAYYTAKLREHGPTHRGVDWSSSESQRTRWQQLLTLLDGDGSVLDYGCGYGGLVAHVPDPGAYVGYDLSEEMVAAARERHPGVRFTTSEAQLEPADYVLASGIFNVKAGAGEEEWVEYVAGVLDRFDTLARRGFAFNMLTSYSDPPLMRPDLHYADPARWFDHCKRHYARNVALLHDYGLWEFTILVRKERG
jgi:SAM-dependent methyltransferase